ncbi:hypothetical protein CPB86DRAFT_780881 [Serendipita vermifera]|nr:hypothetical protein CPB86DRAFT_780881 [Serendipita vermifera]
MQPHSPMTQPYSPTSQPRSPTAGTGTAAQSPYTSGYFGPVPVTAPALVYNETTQPHHSTAYSPPSSRGWTPSQQVDQQAGSSTGVTNSPSNPPVPMWLQKNEAGDTQPTPTSPAPDYTSQHGGHSLYPSVAAMFYGPPKPSAPGPSTGTSHFNYDYPLDKDAKRFSG